MEDSIMTIEEIAKYIKVSERTVLEWAQKGDIPAGKLGNVWRFQKREIDQWISNKLAKRESKEKVIRDLKHLLAPERVMITEYSTKRDILTALINNLSSAPQIKEPKSLEKAIWDREALMSTGIGLGIGIPHVRIYAVSDIAVSVAVNRNNIIDYPALDNVPVRIVFMLAAAYNQHAEYLKVLASISNLLKDESFRKNLLAAKDEQQIYTMLTQGE
ncbi:MAG: PTS sugar transporter subunit IIA [Spirochaetes bacterium]|jgi:PTS system nitrogen regulatory IIA component|nr:PTS sugar transporter subunit IIA [Spirochaetota bacterium]